MSLPALCGRFVSGPGNGRGGLPAEGGAEGNAGPALDAQAPSRANCRVVFVKCHHCASRCRPVPDEGSDQWVPAV